MGRASVGVVVVNWNGLADTTTCLQSLAAAAPGPARIVVVDNGSTDGSLETLRASQADPRVSIIAAGSNRGFAGANNLGLVWLGEDPAITHFLLLNNDATVHPAFFAQLAQALATAPDAAVMGPTIYVTARPGEVWYAGGHFVPLRALVVHEYSVPKHPGPVPTQFVTGCAMLISRRAWETLGPLPEAYFIYLEDAEYSWRASAAGLRVLYAPAAIAYHAVGSAIRRSYASPWVERLKAYNRALFVRRNFSRWERWAALAYLVVTKPGRALIEVSRGRPAVGWAVLRGTAAGLLSKDGQLEIRQPPTVEDPQHGVVVDE
jgi:GT2 family glycosyltransferase